MVTLVCPMCLARWKIIESSDTKDKPEICPNCKPKKRINSNAPIKG